MSIQSLLSTVEGRLANAFFRTVGSEYSLRLSALIESGDVAALSGYPQPDPTKYVDHREFGEDYAAWNFLRKADFLPLGVDRPQVALRSFLDAEVACRDYNRFGVGRPYSSFVGPRLPTGFDQTFGAVFHTAKVKIGKLLGSFNWNKVDAHFGFSGGASTRLPRRAGSPFYKLQGKPEVTRQAALLSVCAIETRKGWKKTRGLDLLSYEDWVSIVEGSDGTTVPKNAKTDRFICKEPCMNMFLQRGFGGFIRRRLKTIGVDLDDQTHNQQLSAIGSNDGSLATIDLKAASDSISLRLVQDLLPGDWYEALVAVRSERVRLTEKDFPLLKNTDFGGLTHESKGRDYWCTLEKISSMGNGFTFELESLIFWALTSTVIELAGIDDTRIGIYGDDIICPTPVAGRVLEVLGYAGFACNVEKTFMDGPFRESCGFHAFNGRDVSPFNVSELIVGRNRVTWFLNTINLWVSRAGSCRKKWLSYLRFSAKLLMKENKLKILPHVPLKLGLEAGLIMDKAYARTFFSFKRSGYRCVAYSPSREKHQVQGLYGVIFALAGRPTLGVLTWDDFIFSDDLTYESIPTGDTKYRSLRGWTSGWCDTTVAFGATVHGFFFDPIT